MAAAGAASRRTSSAGAARSNAPVATQAKADENRTPVYSFRLMTSLQLGRDWRVALARITRPTRIVVGANDELFNADQFQPMMQAINPRVGVTVVPEEGHLAMIADPIAIAAIVAAWRPLAGDGS